MLQSQHGNRTRTNGRINRPGISPTTHLNRQCRNQSSRLTSALPSVRVLAFLPPPGN